MDKKIIGNEATRFKKGQSGNPAGMKPGTKWSHEAILRFHIKKALECPGNPDVIQYLEKKGVEFENKTVAEIAAKQLALQMQDGDLKAMEFAARHTETPMPKELVIDGKIAHEAGELSSAMELIEEITGTQEQGDNAEYLPN